MIAPRPRWQTVQVIACAAVIGWTMAYVLCDWSGWPRYTFDPYDGAWLWTRGPTPRVPINYMGGLLWGAGGAAVAMLIAVGGCGCGADRCPRRRSAWPRPGPSPARPSPAATTAGPSGRSDLTAPL